MALSVVGANSNRDPALAAINAKIGNCDPREPEPPQEVGILRGDELKVVVEANLRADGTLDLIGHASGIRCILKVGDWVIDSSGAIQLAEYLKDLNRTGPLCVKKVRLLGCGTGRNAEILDSIRTHSVTSTRAGEVGPEVEGPSGRIWAAFFDQHGFTGKADMRPGMIRACGVPRWATALGVAPAAAGLQQLSRWQSRAVQLGSWLLLVAQILAAVLTGRYKRFRRMRAFEQSVGRQLSADEAQPGLLTEPLAIARWQHQGRSMRLDVLFDYRSARLYEDNDASSTDGSADATFQIAGAGEPGLSGQAALRQILEEAPPEVSVEMHAEYRLLPPMPPATPGSAPRNHMSRAMLSGVVAVVALAACGGIAFAIGWWNPRARSSVDASANTAVDASTVAVPLVDAPLVDAPGEVVDAVSTRKGMTWGVYRVDAINGVVRVGCQPPDAGPDCDANHGDTLCSTVLPVLCKKPTARPAPPGAVHWSRNEVALTAAVAPIAAGLGSRAAVNEYCAAQLGPGWTVAEHHDYPDGWNFTAYGDLGTAYRFWVDINDQPHATCW
jgi:hypothetical protein